MYSEHSHISYEQTQSFSALVNDYIAAKPNLKDFFQYAADVTGVEAAIEGRKQYAVDRTLLVKVLLRQYKPLDTHPLVRENIESLHHSHTFTICTAHQPNLLTGYLYFFYKILHAISMSEQLNKRYPNQHFVPVYYMGSEDNDLDELGQFNFETNKYKWDADGQTGAVGRMDTKSLKPLFNELFRRMGPPGLHCDNLKDLLTEAYLNHNTIGEATQFLVNQLFGQYGLVIVNPDDAELKKIFLAVMKDDLLEHHALPIVSAQSEKLSAAYKAQAFPRAINLFYLKDNIRERIEQKETHWQVLNTDIQFSKDELLQELDSHPERFSPNVILRGLFQETILPNICFIGGGSELAYWLQLKPLFEYYNIFYPVIFLRQSVQIISEKDWHILCQLNLAIEDIFQPEQTLIQKIITQRKGVTWLLDEAKVDINKTLQRIATQATAIDKNLEQSAAAALAKMNKQMLVLEQKMYKAEKKKEQVLVDKIAKLKNSLMPKGILQERIENFLPYYLQEGFSIFDTIKTTIAPFENQFLIIHPPKV